jgi:hypothetical protein
MRLHAGQSIDRYDIRILARDRAAVRKVRRVERSADIIAQKRIHRRLQHQLT